MDGLRNIPPEITRRIAIEIVKVRGLQRALRLRFVNRSWDREVTAAVVESGILDGLDHVEDAFFWPQYYMHKLQRNQKLLSRPLRILWLVAERVAAFRSSERSPSTHQAIEDCLWEFCQLPQFHFGSGPLRRLIFQDINRMDRIHDTDDDFKETLVAAAASINDVVHLRKLLPTIQGRPDLIFQDGSNQHRLVYRHHMNVMTLMN